MKRFFLFISYIGHNFRGIQRITSKNEIENCKFSVQGIVDSGLDNILGNKFSHITVLSSRTDKGVNAISSCLQVDIDEKGTKTISALSPEGLCIELNYYLEKKNFEIRILRVIEVNPEHHCRHFVSSRNYVYRLAVFKDNVTYNCPDSRLSSALPLQELYRCHVERQPFDHQRIIDSFHMFVGTHNFKNFMKTDREKEKLMTEDSYVKIVKKITFSKCEFPENLNYFDLKYSNFDFYELNIEASGFLRQQVRRIMGSLIAYANGTITLSTIHNLLAKPNKGWNPKIFAASPFGLYLKAVNYSSDLEILRGYLS